MKPNDWKRKGQHERKNSCHWKNDKTEGNQERDKASVAFLHGRGWRKNEIKTIRMATGNYALPGIICPCSRSNACIFFRGTSNGVVPDLAASAAATPAACPIPMHEACTLNPEFASRSLLTHRPATIIFLLDLGIKARKGIVGTFHRLSGLGFTPDFVWRSTG